MIAEFRGQLVRAEIVRSFLFMHRVRLHTARGYFLTWIPSWRLMTREGKQR